MNTAQTLKSEPIEKKKKKKENLRFLRFQANQHDIQSQKNLNYYQTDSKCDHIENNKLML